MNIPNLPVGTIITDENGNPTPTELLWRQQLVQELQQGAGSEGLVPSPQSASDISKIIANKNAQGAYTTAGGTLLYDTTNNLLKLVILVAGVPTLKTVSFT